MFTLFRSLSSTKLMLGQAGSIFTSLLIAQMFYKFGNFSLEAVAFMATWYAIDLITSMLFAKSSTKQG